VVPILIPSAETIDDMIRLSIEAALSSGFIESGQQVVVTGGVPLRVSGKTNFIKVERVR
jgi:pyruvate kinase